MKSISVLGCGWLGFPLAKYLLEKGFELKGSTTDKGKLLLLQKNSISPFLINIDPDIKSDNINEFLSSDILYINFPPKRRDDIEDYHPKQISNLINEIKDSGIKKIIFASSTSVYPNTNDIVDERCDLMPDKNSGKALLEAEKMLMGERGFDTTVIRFAGLIGYERSPLNSLKRKKLVVNPDAKLNLIHRDDCIKISYEIIRNNIWNETLNACSDNHPTRKEYYSVEAKKHGISLPDFDDQDNAEYKIISNRKLKKLLNYEFIYPDPLNITSKSL